MLQLFRRQGMYWPVRRYFSLHKHDLFLCVEPTCLFCHKQGHLCSFNAEGTQKASALGTWQASACWIGGSPSGRSTGSESTETANTNAKFWHFRLECSPLSSLPIDVQTTTAVFEINFCVKICMSITWVYWSDRKGHMQSNGHPHRTGSRSRGGYLDWLALSSLSFCSFVEFSYGICRLDDCLKVALRSYKVTDCSMTARNRSVTRTLLNSGYIER